MVGFLEVRGTCCLDSRHTHNSFVGFRGQVSHPGTFLKRKMCLVLEVEGGSVADYFLEEVRLHGILFLKSNYHKARYHGESFSMKTGLGSYALLFQVESCILSSFLPFFLLCHLPHPLCIHYLTSFWFLNIRHWFLCWSLWSLCLECSPGHLAQSFCYSELT